MTPSQAAPIIGCTVEHVRRLCRLGKLKCKVKRIPTGGFYYDINESSVQQYAELDLGGMPRKYGRS